MDEPHLQAAIAEWQQQHLMRVLALGVWLLAPTQRLARRNDIQEGLRDIHPVDHRTHRRDAVACGAAANQACHRRFNPPENRRLVGRDHQESRTVQQRCRGGAERERLIIGVARQQLVGLPPPTVLETSKPHFQEHQPISMR